jgi:hypothetical protein
VTDAAEWRETVGTWRETARLEGRRGPGPKIDDRRRLGEWVALQLAGEGVALKKSAKGTLGRVLSIVYDAAGIKVPKDLQREARRAIEDTADERQNMH